MKNLTIIFVFFIVTSAHGQSLVDTIPISKNAIFIEALGSSCNIFSIHYDRIIKKNRINFYSMGVGTGYMPYLYRYKSNSVFGISLAFDWNNRLHNKHHLTGGLGLTYSDGLFQLGSRNESKQSHQVLYGSLRIGYKFQKVRKGIYFKIMCTPIFRIYEFSHLISPAPSVFPLISIGAGYSF